MWTPEQIWTWLEEVKDPEIPVLSLVDLGVITKVEITPEEKVNIVLTPTFAGCPAMAYMKKAVEDSLQEHGVSEFNVTLSFDTPWSSNRISEKGKKALKQFGLAPPPAYDRILDLEILEQVTCPYCQSTHTSLRTPFGPTLCRSMHYCHNCHQLFEQFKPV